MHLVLSTGLSEPGASFGNGGPDSGPQAAMRALTPVCERVASGSGGTIVVAEGQRAVSAAARRLSRRGECRHLSIALPHEGFAVSGCPTVPVFGWGMTTIPTVAWGDKPNTDWRLALGTFGSAICLSDSARQAVALAMGPQFPACAVIAAGGLSLPAGAARLPGSLLLDQGCALDTARWSQHRPPVVEFDSADDLADATAATPAEAVLFRPPPPWRKTLRYRLGTTRQHARDWYRDALEDLLPSSVTRAGAKAARLGAKAAYFALSRGSISRPAAVQRDGGASDWQSGALALAGTIFCAVHGMWDRSWSDAISAFVWAFREEAQATLVLRSAHIDAETRSALAGYLKRLLPFRCRVVLIAGPLTASDEHALLSAAAFYVCASHAEAAPLPLMRFMAHGCPAIAPRHSALLEIADESCALLVGASPAHDYWPGDPNERLLTMSSRLDWESLCRAYGRAFELARSPADYGALGGQARQRIQAMDRASEATLAAFLLGRQTEPARRAA